jgi:hypothetical protein
MKKVLAGRYFDNLCTHCKFNHTNNTFFHFEFILVLNLLVINHFVNRGIEIHLLFFHFAWVNFTLFSLTAESLENAKTCSKANRETTEHANKDHENCSLIEDMCRTFFIRAFTMGNTNFKHLLWLGQEGLDVDVHRNFFFVSKENSSECLISLSLRLPYKLVICDEIRLIKHGVAGHLEQVEFKINGLVKIEVLNGTLDVEAVELCLCYV